MAPAQDRRPAADHGFRHRSFGSVLVLGPALSKHVFHAWPDWSAYFIGALGVGSIVGSLLPQAGQPAVQRLAVGLGVSEWPSSASPPRRGSG